MHKEKLNYSTGSLHQEGIVFTKDPSKKAPLVLVAHDYKGRGDFAIAQAEKLASLGYVGVAVDNFGSAKVVTDDNEAMKLIEPLFIDRQELQARMSSALQSARKLPFVEASKVGAIGFCFGGLSVIELLRSGADIKGVVSFHGVISDTLRNTHAKRAPKQNMKGSLLLLHGAEDPMNSWKDLENLANELKQEKVDWEFDLYGHAVHAFTNPKVHDKSTGLAFDEKATARSFDRMELFFKELFA